MKIASLILSLLVSDMKREDIYLELAFIVLFLKVGWSALAAFRVHTVEIVTYRHERTDHQLTGRLSLCH